MSQWGRKQRKIQQEVGRDKCTLRDLSLAALTSPARLCLPECPEPSKNSATSWVPNVRVWETLLIQTIAPSD